MHVAESGACCFSKVTDLKSSKKRNTKYRESELRECQAKGLVRNAIGNVIDRNSKWIQTLIQLKIFTNFHNCKSHQWVATG